MDVGFAVVDVGISIHAPREGCDPIPSGLVSNAVLFQSTHPVRGATIVLRHQIIKIPFQSTHPVRGATIARQAMV